MEIDALHSKFAGVNGTKTKSLRYRLVKRLTSQKRAEQGIFLTRLSKSIIGILSDDFATVDVREELCYHSRPKKTNSEGLKKVNHSKRTIIPKKSRAKNNTNSTLEFVLFPYGAERRIRRLGAAHG